MKLIKFISNTFLFVLVFCLSLMASIGVYSAISYQSDDDYAIIYAMPNDDEKVSYPDSVIFWGEDISNSFKDIKDPANSKLRVAKWFKWAWWKNSMSNVDRYFVDPIVKVVKPIILPITCADEIRTYYDKDISDFRDYIEKNPQTVDNFHSMALTYFDVDFNIADSKLDEVQLQENASKIALNNPRLYADNNGNGSIDMYDVAKEYNYFYQLLFKLYKYNKVNEKGEKVYAKWYSKFVFEDSATHERHLKSSIYGLYTIELISLIFALFFVHENPIAIKKNENGENEISGFKFRHRSKKRKNK